MFTSKNRKELEENGFTVVSSVLTEAECDLYIGEYKEWLKQFNDGQWPRNKSSLIHSHNTGNLEVTWKIRLKSKQVFAQVWGTDKLLSSIDAIAIGRPPEDGEESFATEGSHWLHTDQSARRIGLHAYQGAVYLETTDEDDWTFHLLKGSHKYLDEFYNINPKRGFKSIFNEYYHLRDEDYEWLKKKGCSTIRLPVPKGGMVLWDSRLIHANARPRKNRKHPGRWRYTTFVCMTPAIWATEEDMEDRKDAYESACMTSHWPSLGITYTNTSLSEKSKTESHNSTDLPTIAKTEEARRLWGYLPYNFSDGQPNGTQEVPKLNTLYDALTKKEPRYTKRNFIGSLILFGAGITGLLAFLIYKISWTNN